MATGSRTEFYVVAGLLLTGFVAQCTEIRATRDDLTTQIGALKTDLGGLKTDLGGRIDRLGMRLTREIVGIQNQIVASESRLAEQLGSTLGTLEARITRLEGVHFATGEDKSK